MDNRNLLRMANQIAAYFRAYPDDKAQREVKAHIEAFWEPQMQSALRSYIERGGEHLDSLITHAMRRASQDLHRAGWLMWQT